MSDINYHRHLVSIIGNLELSIINASYIEVDNKLEIISKCQTLGIETEQVQNRLRLMTSTIPIKVFDKLDNFLKVKEINKNSNFLIFTDFGIISFLEEKVYIDFEPKNDYYLIKNTQAFIEFKSFLKNQEREIDGTFHFVDSYNTDLRKLIFVSLSEKGRLNITYELGCPHFNEYIDYSVGLERFKDCFNEANTTLVRFLKSSTINYVSNFPLDSRLKLYFENLNEIVDKARINFEVYLNELSIDKIKKDYDEVKSKYFNSLSDILSKLSQNIIALPIGIAAVLFAIEKIKDTDYFLYLIIASLVVTSIYISLLLKIHFNDLVYIKKVFDYDYSLLIENNFFKKYPNESQLFREIKNRISERVVFLKILIESYFWILNISNMFIIGLALNYLNLSNTGIFILLIIAFILLANYRNNIIEISQSELDKIN